MSDFVRREDVVEALYQAIRTTLTGTFTDSMSLAIAMANNLPSAQPERKKGKWVDGMYYNDFDESEWEKVKCSVCEKYVTKQIFYYDNKYYFCPYCGADMRGDR